VTTLYIVAVGPVPPEPMEWIQAAAAEWFPFPIQRLETLAIPENAYNTARGQYESVEIMKALARTAPRDTARILGVTAADLAIPMLSFLFGQAQLDGIVALVSLCRLRQEFYDLLSDEVLFRERTVKETLHELGHTFGLTHCHDARCPMSLATDIVLVDSKNERYCARCGAYLARRFASFNGAHS